jgi:Putative peptidoglycan binding domain
MSGSGADRDAGGDGADQWLDDTWDDSPAEPGAPSSSQSRRPSTEDETQIVHASRPEIQRRRTIAAVVALLVLGAVIAIPVIAFRGGSDTPAATTTAPPATTAQPTTTAATTTVATTTTPATAAPVELPASGTMRRGDTNTAEVTQLQQALIALGYDNVTADGIFGTDTQAAVADFQAAHGLPNDGIVGPATVDAINAALAAKTG